MTQQELLRWWELLTNEDIKNQSVGFESDFRELIQLNHRVIEQAHEIHNSNKQRKKIDMAGREAFTIIMKYSDEILKLIDHVEDLTRSDVQGMSDAIVMRIIHEVKGSHL